MTLLQAQRIIASVERRNFFGASMALSPICIDDARNEWAIAVQINGQVDPYYVAYSGADIRAIARAAQLHVLRDPFEVGQEVRYG